MNKSIQLDCIYHDVSFRGCLQQKLQPVLDFILSSVEKTEQENRLELGFHFGMSWQLAYFACRTQTILPGSW